MSFCWVYSLRKWVLLVSLICAVCAGILGGALHYAPHHTSPTHTHVIILIPVTWIVLSCYPCFAVLITAHYGLAHEMLLYSTTKELIKVSQWLYVHLVNNYSLLSVLIADHYSAWMCWKCGQWLDLHGMESRPGNCGIFNRYFDDSQSTIIWHMYCILPMHNIWKGL